MMSFFDYDANHTGNDSLHIKPQIEWRKCYESFGGVEFKLK
jgi:hypothetical protein